jgi:uncharacterized protein
MKYGKKVMVLSHLQAGTVHKLKVLREIPTGYVLTDGKIEVLLHIGEATEGLEVDQEVEVFLYQDKKGQLIATMTIPEIQLDTYGWADVVEVVKKLGVFVNIGINKDILVSKDDLPLFQGVWPAVGDRLLVNLETDKKGRLLAKPVTESFVEREREDAPEELLKDFISGWVYLTDKEGSVIITEEGYRGFIHHTERKEEPRLGEWVKGRVIDVKEDGTINVSLRPLKQEGMDADAQEILDYLTNNGGVMPFGDKSDPDDIRSVFKISKAAFKRALGKLMKDGKIEQREGNTYLKENNIE